MDTPVLTTKLHIPSLRPNLVPRRRLLDRLDLGLQKRLTLISAPAGFGKTTLLAEWIENLDASRSEAIEVAWISLDKGDNDPARFATYLSAALQRAEGGTVPESTGALLQESCLVELINRIAALSQVYVLVLDDYHLIAAQVIHDGVTFLVDHLSDNLHLVLATRSDPPLPLARFRARGQLIELRQTDLRFTAEEAASFLNRAMDLELSAQDVAALEARTEGWIAGLQMAALSLQGHSSQRGTRSQFVQAFTGSHRFVLDYLVEEVLDQQPAGTQQFLLRTSILERMNGSLCDALLDIGDWGLEIEDSGSIDAQTQSPIPNLLSPVSSTPSQSSHVLDRLDRANLFVIPLDHERGWYRYHRLFADLLRKRLWQASPQLVPDLHRRASLWHEQQGLVAEAIDHALAAPDFERAATLIEANAEAALMRSEVTSFLNWVARLPDEEVRSRPDLCFFHAWALLMSGSSLDRIQQRVQEMACAQDAPERAGVMAGRRAAIEAYLSMFRADMRRAAELCQQALAQLPDSDLFLHNIVTWILSLVRLFDKDPGEGRRALEGVIKLGQQINSPLVAVTALRYQAKLHARRGQLHRAKETLERALKVATGSDGRLLPIASEALLGLGELKRQWNDLEAAAGHLLESVELASQWSELAAFDAYFPLARIRLAQGDAEAAWQAIQTAQQIAIDSEVTIVDDIVADLQQTHMSVMQGDLEAGVRWAERRGLVSGPSAVACPSPDEDPDLLTARIRKYEHLVLARLFIRQNRGVEAIALLQPLLAQATELGRIDLRIEILTLTALAHAAEGQTADALDALDGALTLAEPGGFVRVFLDEGEPMARLLRQAATQGIAPAYVAKLLAGFAGVESQTSTVARQAAAAVQPLVEPLSERELEVLRLLGTGMSNPEIAEALYVAVSTVRTHCKNIYGKLNVHSRWDAAQRGQELDLI